MAPSHHARKSRRLSRKSPMEVADYDWQGVASLQLLHSGPEVEATPSSAHLDLSSTSTSTTTPDSPPSILSYLPFTPGSSHSRNRKDNHIPRPPNAFMLFRSWLWQKDDLKSVERDNRNVSRIAGRYWNELSEAERAPFRRLAEQVKSIHAKVFPDYRYSPGSQKKPKVSQRRSQRSADVEIEKEKCKKVADLLLEGVTSRDLSKYLVDNRKKVKSEEVVTFVPAAEESPVSVAPRNARKRPAAPRRVSPPVQVVPEKPKTFPAHLITTPPPQYVAPLPVPLVTDESFMIPAPLVCTPELTYPHDGVEEFVPTNDIPHLSLDNCDGLKLIDEHDLFTLFPPHLRPAEHTVFGATSSVDIGLYNADILDLPSVLPFAEFDPEPFPSLVPLGSPVFTNPFEPSPTTMHASLDALDQLFGHAISPLTPIFPYEQA